jgi:hypothetical protein
MYIEAARGRYAKIDVEFAWYIGRWEGKGICKERGSGSGMIRLYTQRQNRVETAMHGVTVNRVTQES